MKLKLYDSFCNVVYFTDRQVIVDLPERMRNGCWSRMPIALSSLSQRQLKHLYGNRQLYREFS